MVRTGIYFDYLCIYLSYRTSCSRSRLDVLLGGGLDGGAELGVDLGEHVVGAVAGVDVGVAQVARDVGDEVVLLAGSAAEHAPQAVGLLVVVRLHLVE